jgi:hypothetical protein
VYKTLLILLLIPGLAGLLIAQNESTVDISDESHHQLLLENEKVRVFEVDLPAHQSTPLVRHDHNFLVITLEDAEIASWAEGRAGVITYQYKRNDVRFFFGGPARALRNDTPNTYRNLTVEFLSPKVTTLGFDIAEKRWEYGSNAMLPPTDPQKGFTETMDLGEARVKDVQLMPEDEYPEPEKSVDELLLPLTDLELKKNGLRIRKDQYTPFWIPAGRNVKFMNDATVPARMVVIELH